MSNKERSATRLIPVEIDGKTLELSITISLTDEEIRRLILPVIVEAMANEVRRKGIGPRASYSGGTSVL